VTYREGVSVSWGVEHVARVRTDGVRLQLDHEPSWDAYVRPVGGVYFWFVTHEIRPHGGTDVVAAYIGQAGNLENRINQYLDASAGPGTTTSRTVDHLINELNSTAGTRHIREAFLGVATDVGIRYDHPGFEGEVFKWNPNDESHRLAVESAAVAYAIHVRNINLSNVLRINQL